MYMGPQPRDLNMSWCSPTCSGHTFLRFARDLSVVTPCSPQPGGNAMRGAAAQPSMFMGSVGMCVVGLRVCAYFDACKNLCNGNAAVGSSGLETHGLNQA